jgi:hypothetical protein
MTRSHHLRGTQTHLLACGVCLDNVLELALLGAGVDVVDLGFNTYLAGKGTRGQQKYDSKVVEVQAMALSAGRHRCACKE